MSLKNSIASALSPKPSFQAGMTSNPLNQSTAFGFDFSQISLPAGIAHLDCGFDRMHRWQTFFKRLAIIEEGYAKELTKLIEDTRADEGRAQPIPSASAPASESAAIFRLIIQQVEKVSMLHENHVASLRNYITTPMRLWRKDREPAKKKLGQQSSQLMSQQKDVKNQIDKERQRCITALLVFKEANINDPEMVTVDNAVRRLPPEKQANFAPSEIKKLGVIDKLRGAHKAVDKGTLQQQLRHFNDQRVGSHVKRKKMYADEGGLLKEYEQIEEERLKTIVEFFGKHARHYQSDVTAPIQAIFKDIEDKVRSYDARTELRNSCEVTMMTAARESLRFLEYGIPYLSEEFTMNDEPDILPESFPPMKMPSMSLSQPSDALLSLSASSPMVAPSPLLTGGLKTPGGAGHERSISQISPSPLVAVTMPADSLSSNPMTRPSAKSDAVGFNVSRPSSQSIDQSQSQVSRATIVTANGETLAAGAFGIIPGANRPKGPPPSKSLSETSSSSSASSSSQSANSPAPRVGGSVSVELILLKISSPYGNCQLLTTACPDVTAIKQKSLSSLERQGREVPSDRLMKGRCIVGDDIIEDSTPMDRLIEMARAHIQMGKPKTLDVEIVTQDTKDDEENASSDEDKNSTQNQQQAAGNKKSHSNFSAQKSHQNVSETLSSSPPSQPHSMHELEVAMNSMKGPATSSKPFYGSGIQKRPGWGAGNVATSSAGAKPPIKSAFADQDEEDPESDYELELQQQSQSSYALPVPAGRPPTQSYALPLPPGAGPSASSYNTSAAPRHSHPLPTPAGPPPTSRLTQYHPMPGLPAQHNIPLPQGLPPTPQSYQTQSQSYQPSHASYSTNYGGLAPQPDDQSSYMDNGGGGDDGYYSEPDYPDDGDNGNPY